MQNTMITNFTKEEKREKIYTNKNGDFIMYDEYGRKWTLVGAFETLEDVKKAEELLNSKKE